MYLLPARECMVTIKRLTIFSFFIFLLSCASASKKQIEEEADIYFGMGTNALINKNYTVALTNLLSAVEKAPNRSDIHNNLGMAYYFKKQPQLALKHIQTAIKLDPKNTDARSNLASLYLDMKKYSEAKEFYKQVLTDLTYPKQYITYYNLGKIEYDLKNFNEAKNYFSLSIKENPNACASQYYIGLIEYKAKNYKASQNYFKEAYYGVCYSNEYPLYYHGLSLEKSSEYQKALGRYQELIDRFPNSQLVPKAQERIKVVSVLQSESKPLGSMANQDDQMFSLPDDKGEQSNNSPEF